MSPDFFLGALIATAGCAAGLLVRWLRAPAQGTAKKEDGQSELDLPVTPYELRELHGEEDQEKIRAALRVIRAALRAKWEPGRFVQVEVPDYGSLKSQLKDDIREALEQEGWQLQPVADGRYWPNLVNVEELPAAEGKREAEDGL